MAASGAARPFRDLDKIAAMRPVTMARAAGAFWLATIVTGMFALSGGRLGNAANLAATVCYFAATLLVYALLKPVNAHLSLFAALFSLAGCALSVVISLRLAVVPVNPLVFFGVHCLTVGYLIVRSTFLPPFLGVLLGIGGLGWLTFANPAFAARLAPWIILPGIIGEGALSLWLLTRGVDAARWETKAGRPGT